MTTGILRAGAIATALVLGPVGLGPAALEAATLRGTGLLVLGDSLSDTGNAYAITGGETPPIQPLSL